MLKGRLGLESADVPQADRHGVLWFGRGRLVVEGGTLKFVTAGNADLEAGSYLVPYQMASAIVLQPGMTVTHDVLRLCASHGVALVAAGEGGVRFYATVLPLGPDRSTRARRQARLWAAMDTRTYVARRMYAFRLGELFPDAEMAVLRGMEGARAKENYKRIAREFGITWHGRRYDRAKPMAADVPNQAINHASAAVVAAAQVAVAVSGTIPQLGFIHEESAIALALDIADLFRDSITLPIAFGAVKARRGDRPLERVVRHHAGRTLRKQKVVATMIDRIKDLFDSEEDEEGGATSCP
ncbi:MAG TPA: type I-E CRISPR-associated endonuclease Cas1e [Polyangiaceae bacterium LLY-WYZ-15_(1-7)]|nr:type I-E CRISPR-associated endonuclease Cas1 [Sandaracinus sp.]HJK91382.1 type I-E CRISPR-associated endonuclease Cas1e [Polyangiaceae bacterium LLY-WYZ-15_(1-7)]HJL06422.1 type I-E CRISPR-associated endonuclease Cas1e [Polyangiaceae bacterium LLY-WYZ-15_(1-7)]HJL10324.1 type I-E CRISPR-associated endonuclease Cas1e [Polyangiaceae bacterium LLY-WYZ-15_(1-7)]HJL24834.1 type I-E CRISPR-associated endonuclease Cas1e [Polyangiaceae bacterium LLY-WYZ-15_(1-7)]